VRLLYNTGGEHGMIAESIAQMWKRVLGVDTRLIGKEPRTFAEDKQNQVFMVCRASWYGDYLDPTTFLDTLRSDNGNNDSAYRDPAFDAMLDAASACVDPRQRLGLLADAERYIVNETVPILPIFRFVHVNAFDPDRIRGLSLNPRLVFSLHDVEVTP
jgi:oligopeptide transport system substrate-binding protein